MYSYAISTSIKFSAWFLLGILTCSCQPQTITAEATCCELDEFYLCRNIQLVTACNKVETCRKKVWQSWQSNNEKSSTPSHSQWCNACLIICKNLHDWVAENSTAVEIEDYLKKKICSRLDIEALIKECEDIVMTQVPNLQQLLVRNFDPSDICRALKFCPEVVSINAIVDKQLPDHTQFDVSDEYHDESSGRWNRVSSGDSRLLKSGHTLRRSKTRCGRCLRGALKMTSRAGLLQRLSVDAEWMAQMLCHGSSSCVQLARHHSVQIMSQLATPGGAFDACTALAMCRPSL